MRMLCFSRRSMKAASMPPPRDSPLRRFQHALDRMLSVVRRPDSSDLADCVNVGLVAAGLRPGAVVDSIPHRSRASRAAVLAAIGDLERSGHVVAVPSPTKVEIAVFGPASQKVHLKEPKDDREWAAFLGLPTCVRGYPCPRADATLRASCSFATPGRLHQLDLFRVCCTTDESSGALRELTQWAARSNRVLGPAILRERGVHDVRVAFWVRVDPHTSA